MVNKARPILPIAKDGSVRIRCDTREKRCVKFPKYIVIWWNGQPYRPVRIDPVQIKMDTADYDLGDWPGLCCVERKGSISELHKNIFTKDRSRFLDCLDRMVAEYQRATLACCFSPRSLLVAGKYMKAPSFVTDAVMQECYDRSIDFLMIPEIKPEAKTGEMIARILINQCLILTERTDNDRRK